MAKTLAIVTIVTIFGASLSQFLFTELATLAVLAGGIIFSEQVRPTHKSATRIMGPATKKWRNSQTRNLGSRVNGRAPICMCLFCSYSFIFELGMTETSNEFQVKSCDLICFF